MFKTSRSIKWTTRTSPLVPGCMSCITGGSTMLLASFSWYSFCSFTLNTLLNDFCCFSNFLLLSERRAGCVSLVGETQPASHGLWTNVASFSWRILSSSNKSKYVGHGHRCWHSVTPRRPSPCLCLSLSPPLFNKADLVSQWPFRGEITWQVWGQ